MKPKLILFLLLMPLLALAAEDVNVTHPIGQKEARDSVSVVPASGANFSVTSTSATATTVVSTALEASKVLKASAGSLVSIHGFNSKASAQYILIMNSATVPADGAVTLLYPPIYVPATSNFSLTFPVPLTASTGISVSNSSTGSFTKTAGAADCIYTAQVQ